MFSLKSEFFFFLERKFDSLGGEEGDDGFLSLSDDEDVVDSSGEGVAIGILDMGDSEATRVLLNVLKNSDSANIVSSSDGD